MPLHRNACISSCAPKSKWSPLSRVRLHQNVFVYSFVSKSNFFFLVRAYIKTFSDIRVCLHQNGYFFSFAPKSKYLLFLVWTLIKMFSCIRQCVSTSKWLPFLMRVYIKMFSYILVDQFFLLLVCVYIKMFSYIRVSTSKWSLYSCAPTLKLLLFPLCAYINFFPLLVFACIKTIADTQCAR